MKVRVVLPASRSRAMMVIVALSNIGLYGLPYMRDQFYDIMISALQLSHGELSFLFTIFGTVSLFSYVLGGPIVDRFSSKRLMCASLFLSGVLHLYVTTSPSYEVLCVVFGVMALAACFTFYPASMKLLNSLRDEGGKGKVFGSYVSLIGVFGIAVVLLGIFVLQLHTESIVVFQTVVAAYGVLDLLMCLLLGLFMDDSQVSDAASDGIRAADLPKLVFDRRLWCVAGIMFFNYLAAAIMTYLIPYLSQSGMDETSTVVIAVLRTNVITVFAPALAGIMTDRIRSAISMHFLAFLFAGVGSVVLLASTVLSMSVFVAVGAALLVSFFLVGAKSVNMVLISEVHIPSFLFGSAVGLVSFVSFSPDAFFYQIAGSVLDSFPSEAFTILFGMLVFVMFAGLLVCICLKTLLKRDAHVGDGQDM